MQCHFSQSGLKPLNNEEASAEGAFTNIKMSGQEVFRFAVRAVPLVGATMTNAALHSSSCCIVQLPCSDS